jgi:Icc-related predicted phosphoesterase
MPDSKETIRIAAVGDLHCGKSSQGAFQALFASLHDRADVLLLCGDITDYGLPEEARNITRDLAASVKIPTLAVLGNHDFESGRAQEVTDIFREAGIKVLDGDAVEVHGVGFAGAKGFCGGFGPRTLAPWGEQSIKSFVHEAVGEALKLESALAKLRMPRRVALLHYSPIEATVQGEPREIYPFLGSSRLEEPLNRFQVSAVFHGHAHHGAVEGRTSTGAPVYNVALPLLRRTYPDVPPVRIIEMPIAGDLAMAAGRRATDHPENATVAPPLEKVQG